MKIDLLTNATVVDDAFRFVSLNFKEKVQSTDNSGTGSGNWENNGYYYNHEPSFLNSPAAFEITISIAYYVIE